MKFFNKFDLSKMKCTTEDEEIIFRLGGITQSMIYDVFYTLEILSDVDAQTLVEKSTHSFNFHSFFR
ncbi:unnamed protein product [Linum trigynum]|uniref:Uncharacterized protein n=1 Tax=Linum trigynum TaxID=586398 RepID=A0AAV2EXI0_9ROSI